MSTPPSTDIVVRHDAAEQRFTAEVNGLPSLLQYRSAPGKIIFVHTEVSPALQGHGVGDALAHAGLEFARAEGLAVVPLCPFVAAYIRRHPEYQSLVHLR